VEPIEVPFVDGIIELSNIVQVHGESISLSGSSPLYTYILTKGNNLDLSSSPVFTNTTLFTTEVTYPPDGNGDYNINLTNGTITVFNDDIGSIVDFGTVDYNFIDTTLDASLPGKFSVDYRRGRIYSFSLTQTPADDKKITYQYTNYAIDYNIAKPINSNSFIVDAENKQISINDTEIIKAYNSIDIVSKTRQIIKIMYQYVERTRDSIKDLDPYFSPIVKDYVLKILTKSKI
jgi:hypothetical protein